MNRQVPFAFDVFSVSGITNQIQALLESNFTDVLVEGELSNVNQSRNGHWYFTIKDDKAQLPCVIWRSRAERLDVTPADGQQVVVGGDLQVYAPHGRYQMIVSLVQQAGVGKLQQKFEELKAKLQNEGLFDDIHKKPLPTFPTRIGVITSSTGAAFQDIKSTFEKRWPLATLYLHHASVQGLNASGELVKAINYFAEQTNPVELIIIGRGGGSLEDLWPFNEEAVARALFACPIPTISAVGHEVDFSISDFVADARAATPTQAAVIAAPDSSDLKIQIDDYSFTIERFLKENIKKYREYINRLVHSHALLKIQDRIEHERSKIKTLTEQMSSRFENRLFRQQSLVENLEKSIANTFERRVMSDRSRFQSLVHALEKQNPKAPLDRGFTRILQDGKWVRSKNQFQSKETFEIEWKDGDVQVN